MRQVNIHLAGDDGFIHFIKRDFKTTNLEITWSKKLNTFENNSYFEFIYAHNVDSKFEMTTFREYCNAEKLECFPNTIFFSWFDYVQCRGFLDIQTNLKLFRLNITGRTFLTKLPILNCGEIEKFILKTLDK